MSSYEKDFEEEDDGPTEQLIPLKALSQKEKNDLIKESYRASINTVPRHKVPAPANTSCAA